MVKKLGTYLLCVAVAGLAASCSSMSPAREQGCLIGAGLGALAGGGIAAAEMVSVEDDALDPGEMVAGLKAQLRPAGAAQESVI